MCIMLYNKWSLDDNHVIAGLVSILLTWILGDDRFHLLWCIKRPKRKAYDETMGPTVKRGNLEFLHGILDALLFVEKDFIAIMMYSKRRFVYISVYGWTVNALSPTKSSLGMAHSVSLLHRELVLCIHRSNQFHFSLILF